MAGESILNFFENPGPDGDNTLVIGGSMVTPTGENLKTIVYNTVIPLGDANPNPRFMLPKAGLVTGFRAVYKGFTTTVANKFHMRLATTASDRLLLTIDLPIGITLDTFFTPDVISIPYSGDPHYIYFFLDNDGDTFTSELSIAAFVEFG